MFISHFNYVDMVGTTCGFRCPQWPVGSVNPLELEVTAAMSSVWVLEIKLWSSGRASNVLNHSTISTVPGLSWLPYLGWEDLPTMGGTIPLIEDPRLHKSGESNLSSTVQCIHCSLLPSDGLWPVASDSWYCDFPVSQNGAVSKINTFSFKFLLPRCFITAMGKKLKQFITCLISQTHLLW